MMKKLSAIILTAAILFCFSACEKDNNDDNKEQNRTMGDNITSQENIDGENTEEINSTKDTKNIEIINSIEEELAESFLYDYDYENNGICVTGYIGDKKEFRIPAEIDGEPVVSIGDYAFSGESEEDLYLDYCIEPEIPELTKLVIPDGVVHIGNRAFSGCENLTEVYIPESVMTIGESAFTHCNMLTDITLPDSIMSIGDWAFSYCDNLTNINIPKNLLNISGSLFEYCPNLTNVIIPDGVTSIGSRAFMGCNSITSITIPDSVTYIAENAFYDCKGLTDIKLSENLTGISDNMFTYCSNLTGIDIPESVTYIGHGVFFYCTSFTNITVPETVTSISETAFDYCENIKVTYKDVEYDYNRLNAFYYAVNANENSSANEFFAFERDDENNGVRITKYLGGEETNLVIPDTIDGEPVVSIGKEAFYRADFTSVTIPDSVKSIGDSAFNYCQNLMNITLGNGITSIGESVFSSCTNLTEVIIPDGVTKISYGLFYACYKLTSITIPNGVTHIDTQAFYDCMELKEITFPDSVTGIGNSIFYYGVKVTYKGVEYSCDDYDQTIEFYDMINGG